MVGRVSGPWWVAMVVLLAADRHPAASGGVAVGGGATTGPSLTQRAVAPTTAAPQETATAASTAGQAGGPIWFQSLQMTSATSGWALAYTSNPADLTPVPYISLVHTGDGARTWTNVTPSAARPMLAGLYSYEALDPVDGEHAYLAVTVGTPDGDAATVNPTAIFATADGGRTWTETAMLKAAGDASQLIFANAQDGWLLMDEYFGETPQPAWLYRTVDGGQHWSAISTRPSGGATYGPNGFCHAMGLSFPATPATPATAAASSASTGWLTVDCRAQTAIMVSHDGGSTWLPQALPLPSSDFIGDPATMTGPQFVGGTEFLTVAPAPPAAPPAAPPTLLVSQDLGQTWQSLALPSGAGQYPQISLFSPTEGVLVPAASQEALGTVFYTTADGGQTWTPVPQGTHFTQPGATIDFTSPQSGFAWNSGGDTSGASAPPLYATTNSGRTWQSFTASLAS